MVGGVLFVVLLSSAGIVPSAANGTIAVPPPPLEGAATVGNIDGHVFGSWGPGSIPVPLAGVEVNVTLSNFTTLVASTVTNGSGAYNVTVPPGTYYIWSNHTGEWGGGGIPDRITVPAGNLTVNLTAYPYVGYGNATYVLPGWNRLAAYMDKGNVMDSQQPMLSWTQDGAYYVNATDQLVFYSFPNGTVTEIAPWVPLYENVMNYAGWENEEFITPDGSWIYGLGCLASCALSSHLTLYAVNVSTGRTFEYNWTSEDTGLQTNGQVNLVGEQGNLSTAVMIDDTGNLWMYNLWNHTQWEGPKLPYFEANNIYWIPYLSSYINVQAGGSDLNGIDQWELSGPGDGTTFTDVFSSHYGGDFPTNAVTGPVFNISSRMLVFDSYSKGAWYTFEYTVTPSNVLDQLTVLDDQGPGSSTYADEKLTMDITADEHRASLVLDGPAFAGAFWPFFDNRSFVVNPFNRVFYDTNQTPGVFYNQTYSPDQAAASSDTVDGLFFNGSYLINPYAYDCDAGPCPINGGEGFSTGTVWWLWKVGSPQFPSPASAPLVQDVAPGPVTVSNSTPSSSSVQIFWTGPSVGQYPLLNFTVAWGYSEGNYTNSATTDPSARGLDLTGLDPGTTVYYQVAAWNLHWHGPFTEGAVTLAPGRPAAPTGVAATYVSSRQIDLRWTPPPESVQNYTLYWGTRCASLTHSVNVGADPVASLSGFLPRTTYCFVVQAWNSVGSSPLSAGSLVRTLGEVGGHHLPLVVSIPYVPPPAVHSTGPPCGGFCFPSFPTPLQPQFWLAGALALAGGVLAVRGRRALGGATLAVAIVLFFL